MSALTNIQKAFDEACGKACEQAVAKCSAEILADMKAACPVDTGATQASISRAVSRAGKNSTAFIGSTRPSLYYINYGNGGSAITPKSHMYLKYPSKGKYHGAFESGGYVFARSVSPYEGRHFIEKIAAAYDGKVY